MSSFKKEKCFHEFSSFKMDLIYSIETARVSIDINVYIFQLDEVGSDIFRHLVSAAKRGVKIRLLVDGFGSREFVSECFTSLSSKNLSIRVYHPLSFKMSLYSFSFLKVLQKFISRLNKRDHKKLFIFDNQFFYVGSANICEASLKQKEILIKTYDSLSEALTYYEYTWSNSYSIDKIGKIPFKFKKTKINKFSQSDLICNFNFFSRKENYKRLLKLIINSHRIWLMTPYFMPPQKYLKALGRVAEQGGDVRIILPSKIDIHSMKIAAQYYYPYLIKKNVRIFLYEDKILHAKLTIVDDCYVVGSSNLDHRSFFTNLEIDLFISDIDVKDELEKSFEEALASCTEVSASDIARTPFSIVVLSKILFFLRKWL